MKSIDLEELVTGLNGDRRRRYELFALLNLGVVELLANGALSSAEATKFFFNARNCLFVRKQLRDKAADAIMSHGVQLNDLFEALPEKDAQKQFQRELGLIRALSLKLLEKRQLVG